MAAVLSVQKHTITLPAGTSGVSSATLSPAVDTDNCIPFVTARVTDDNGAIHSAYAVRARFDTSTTVEVSTGYAVSRALVVEVTVVEFNPSEVTVQSGTLAMAASSQTDAPSYTAVTSANTFLYHTWTNDSTFSTYYSATTVRGNIFGSPTSTSISFSRQDGTGAIAGTWYLAEATGGAFAVEHLDWQLTASDTTTATIVTLAPVDTAKTFLLGSYKSNNDSDFTDRATVDVYLNTSSQVAVNRVGTTDTVYGYVQVIEFDSGGDETVYRGTVTGTDGDDTAAIGATVSDDSMVHVAGVPGSFTTGSFAGTDPGDCPDAHCALTFPTSTQIQIQHGTSGGDTGDVSWEVVEWLPGAPASTRRVMVRG